MHSIHPKRTRQLNNKNPQKGPILYFMDRDRRVHDNWALLHAQNLAIQAESELHIVYVMAPNYLESNWRQHHFMIEGFKEIELECKKLGIRFEVFSDEPVETLIQYCKNHKIGALVTDFTPLKRARSWRTELARKMDIPVLEVDTHNIIPCWIASPKEEFAAYTFRPKVHRQLDEYLTEFPKLNAQSPASDYIENNWPILIKKLKLDESVKPIKWIKAGEKNAQEILLDFIENKLEAYGEARNDPNKEALSNLSPYLHYGQISAQGIALKIHKKLLKEHDLGGISKALQESADSFLEELIVRRELADNYCYYNPNYDNPKGFHNWAQKTVDAHRMDPREYLYTQNQFETANTHDPLWNAAQEELLQTGKMHGYIRMYWCKKILEWTPSVEIAMKIAIYLNDRYELDGRDPNGYTGIAWSIGGVHDRAWGEREVFGKVRYMNFKGCKRKFDVKNYISKWAGAKQLSLI